MSAGCDKLVAYVEGNCYKRLFGEGLHGEKVWVVVTIGIIIITVVLVAQKDPKGFKKSSYNRRRKWQLFTIGGDCEVKW